MGNVRISKNKKTTYIVVYTDRQIAIGAYNRFLQAAQKGELSPAACKAAGITNDQIKSLRLVARKAKKDANSKLVNIDTLKSIVGKKSIKLEEFQEIISNGIQKIKTAAIDGRTKAAKLLKSVVNAVAERIKRQRAFAAKRLYKVYAAMRSKTSGFEYTEREGDILYYALGDSYDGHNVDLSSLMVDCLKQMATVGLSLRYSNSAKSGKALDKKRKDEILTETVELNKFRLSFVGLSL